MQEKTTKKMKRVSKGQWLEQALDLFARVGEQGLAIEVLAREVGVAKAGFYWHFKDRADLLDQLLDYWEHEDTAVIRDNPLVLALPPRERLHTVMKLVEENELYRHSIQIRAWAAKDPDVRRRVVAIYQSQLDFIKRAILELGYEGEDADMRARLFVVYQSNFPSMFGLRGKARTRRDRETRLKIILGETD